MEKGYKPSRLDKSSRRQFSRNSGITLATALFAPAVLRITPAVAAFPDRPIKILVPFGPGGPLDVIARIIAPPLGEALGGATLVIENRAGASGNLGIGMVARGDADGYTILVAASTMVINTMLFTSLPYDIDADLMPVADLASSPNGFAVNPSTGIKTVADFVAFAKRSGKVNYSHSGRGTPAHLAAEYLKTRAGIEMAAVNHNGAGPAIQALLSGAVEFSSVSLPAVHPHIAAGTLTGLAVTGEKRWFDLPNVPTMIDAGYPGFVIEMFNALFLPARTPPEIAHKLSSAALKVLQSEEMHARLRSAGFEPTGGTPESLRAKIARERVLWREVVKAAALEPTAAK